MIRRLLTSFLDRDDTYHECQDCGTAVASAEDPCPECGSSDVSSFDIDGST